MPSLIVMGTPIGVFRKRSLPEAAQWLVGLSCVCMVQNVSVPLSDLFVWGVGVDLDAALGGPQFAFAEGGINMDYVGERTAVGLKGVAGTILHYDKVWNPVTGDYVQLPAGGMGSNRIRFIVRHGAGMQHRLQPIFEIFRGD